MVSSAQDTPSGRGAGRTFAVVLGSVALLIGSLVLVGGAVLVGVHATQRDADGYYASGARTLSTPTHAFVSDGLDVGTDGPDWLFRQAPLGTVRVTAAPAGSKPIFVGIARTAQVDRYLGGVAYDRITDLEVDPLSVTTARRPGAATPAAPADQTFWRRSASGHGRRTITWPVEKGSWAVVVMNADGSRGVSSGVTVGAKVGIVLWLGIGMLTAGALLAIGGGVALAFGVRRPRPSRSAGVAPDPSAATPAGTSA